MGNGEKIDRFYRKTAQRFFARFFRIVNRAFSLYGDRHFEERETA